MTDFPPADHLLRTFGAVPPGQRVLVREKQSGRHALPLARLGFDVHVADDREEARQQLQQQAAREGVDLQPARSGLDYPDAHFAWSVVYAPTFGEATAEDIAAFLKSLRPLIRPGGWLYVALPAGRVNAFVDAELHSTEGLRSLMDKANFERAERPVLIEEERRVLVRGIYRRVEEDTPA